MPVSTGRIKANGMNVFMSLLFVMIVFTRNRNVTQVNSENANKDNCTDDPVSDADCPGHTQYHVENDVIVEQRDR